MNKKKTMRRVCSAALASTLIIALSSCGSSDNTGKLDLNKIYAEAGEYKLSYGELWNELKWQSKDVLKEQVNVVVLQNYIDDIKLFVDGSYQDLDDNQKNDFDIENEDDFNNLKKKYQDRLVDYVIQDIYNFEFSMDDYYKEYEKITQDTINLCEAKYVDEAFTNYQVDEINGVSLSSMIAGVEPENNYDNYLSIATSDTLRQVYYLDFAKELFAIDKKTSEVKDADDADNDDDDNKWGYFATSEYVSQFREDCTHLNKVDIVLIRFTSQTEFENTLRAFGIRIYNGKYYYIADKKNMTYDEYIEYYDDLSTTQYNESNNVRIIDNDAILEIFVQLYNYIYSGYRPLLQTGSNYEFEGKDVTEIGLDKLRFLTEVIFEDYSYEAELKYQNAVQVLTETPEYRDLENDTRTLYTAEEINDISRTLGNNIFDTLDHTVPSKRYATATTSTSATNYYFMFKFNEEQFTSEDGDNYEDLQRYHDYYSTDLTESELLQYIEKEDLKDTLEEALIRSRITSSTIDTLLTNAKKDVEIKIYNEPCEIAYLAENSDYSKALGSADNDNVLATIEYNGKTYNLNICSDDDDSKSVLIPGTDKGFGVFDYLEQTTGATTAIDLLSKKIVKDTNAYKDTNKDRDTYERYIENILYSFTNGQYASSGYDASIGKYNFLMLYFHTASIDEIIDNFYRVQFASAKLLTDYSSDYLANFFKTYTDLAYDNFFSISATRLYVYFDGDEDGNPDDVDSSDPNNWINHVITAEETTEASFVGLTRQEVAKQMILDIYTLISASTSSHADRLSELVEEIQGSARAEYETNPIVAENRWAKYLHLGLNVKNEDITATNSSIDIDFNIKQRLYDYANGYNKDKTKTYQYFMNDTIPTCYIEKLTDSSVSTANDDIVESKDGYNLLLVTSGKVKSSAKWEKKDNSEGILENLYLKYNDNGVVIDNIYNDEEKLNLNQIKLYIVDYALNSSSTLAPSGLSDAYSSYLSSAVSRFTGSETQRIILLNFIKNRISSTSELYDVITFTANPDYNGADGVFAKFIKIDQNSADQYLYIYDDITGTSLPFDYEKDGEIITWWDEILKIVNELLMDDEKGDN